MAPSFRPHETFGYALKQAQQAMRAHMDRRLREIGLTAPQYAVLASLEEEPGASNAMLARRAFVTPQTMQGMLVKLERDGMIERKPDTEHGRIQRTELTVAGRRALNGAHTVAVDVERRVRASLGAVEPEEAIGMLLKAAEAMR